MARILIIEDNANNLELMEYLLSAFGHWPLLAHDGIEGLETARREVPDLILLDIQMPGIDGYEVVRQLKQDEKLREIPIIAITAMAMVGDRERILSAGFDGYLAKPIDPEAFREQVQSFLSSPRPSAAKTSSPAPQTILVVDDRPLNRKFLTTLLGYRGYSLLEAQDGAEALLLTRMHRPSLVIVDILMPTMDGYEFTRRLRAEPELAETPVIFYTATYREREARAMADTCGVSAIIAKPAEPQEVLRIVSEVLGHPPKISAPQGAAELPLDLPERLFKEGLAREAVSLRLAALLEASLELSMEHTPERLLETFTRAARDIIGARYCSAAFLEKDSTSVRYSSCWGVQASEAFIPPQEQLAVLLKERRPQRLKAPIDQAGATSLLVVPIASHDRVYGWLSLAEKVGLGEFSQEEERLALALASQVAVCYENTLRHEEIQRRVHELEREISERKRIEEVHKRLEDQLRQSQKMEAIGQLAGGVAHDFNNLLTIISSYSALALAALSPREPMYEDISEINKAADRASALTRQLLAFSRQQVAQPKILDLNATVSEMDKLLRRLIGEDIDLITIAEKNLRRIKADPGQMEQIIVNLAVNARDAMPQGGKLLIETNNVSLDADFAKEHLGVTPGEYVLLAVSDNGCGMDRTTQQRIFEPFFTTKEKGKGTGLGLSTVYGIVQQHGGNIWVYSEPNRGTTFKIYLPAVEEETSLTKSSKIPIITYGRETILCVEDDPFIRKLLEKVLKKSGYVVLLASNGAEALQLEAQHKAEIHLLITDVVMPETSGPELVKQLHARRPDVKVLYLSGYTDNTIAGLNLLETGFAFLQKPFTPSSLSAKVREVLSQELV